MPTDIMPLAEWQELMGTLDRESREQLRAKRREGLIQITGLSQTRSAVVSRARRREARRLRG